MNDLKTLNNALNRSAATYDRYALVPQEIAARMLERLDYLSMQPRTILDLGCGTGHVTAQLQARFPEALVIGVDAAEAMLAQAQSMYPKNSVMWMQARMEQLPIPDACIDLIFSNQAWYYSQEDDPLWRECSRVMSPQACIFFSTLGPNTFKELSQAWQQVDDYPHGSQFLDMHDVGDRLLQHGWLDPVVDREDLEVHFESFSSMLQHLRGQGIKNFHPERFPYLTSKKRFHQFQQAYLASQDMSSGCALTYEIIHAHAWKGQVHAGKMGDEIRLPAKISRRGD